MNVNFGNSYSSNANNFLKPLSQQNNNNDFQKYKKPKNKRRTSSKSNSGNEDAREGDESTGYILKRNCKKLRQGG